MMAGSTRGKQGCIHCSICTVWWRALKWLPVVLIFSIVAWSYYAYVVQLNFYIIENPWTRIFYLVPYHILLVFFMWAYVKTIFAQIKPIPNKFKLPQSEVNKLLAAESEDAQRQLLEYFAKDLPTVTRTMSGAVRYCSRCVLVKPDRSHHCSVCGSCVLKMDHHCPWVNNCVCFHNYKFFMLFLCYALVYCIFVMLTVLPYFVQFWKSSFQEGRIKRSCEEYPDPMRISCYQHYEQVIGTNRQFPVNSLGGVANSGQFHVVFVFFVALMFGISLGSLFGYHCYLVLNNRTTLESFRAPMFRSGIDKNGFSLGAFNNFKEVFGHIPLLWFIPVFTSPGDGCEFPTRPEHRRQPGAELRGYDAMGHTRPSEETSETWSFCPGRTAPAIV